MSRFPLAILAFAVGVRAVVAIPSLFLTRPAVQPGHVNATARPDAAANTFAYRASLLEEGGNRLFAMGRYADAMVVYGKLIALHKSRAPNKSDAAAYYAKARCERRLCMSTEAIEDLNMAIKLAPDMGDAYYARGMEFLEQQNDAHKALADFKTCSQLPPHSADAFCSLGRAYFQLGNSEMALASYKRSLEINPHLAWSYNNIAMVYFSQGQYEKALSYEEKAVINEPASGHHLYKRGLIRQQLGMTAQAQKDFASARQLGFDVDNASVEVHSVSAKIVKGR